MLLPLPLIGLVETLRFLLLELPRERDRNRLVRRRERIELVEHYGLVGEDRTAVVAHLAAGKSIRRALRARVGEP